MTYVHASFPQHGISLIRKNRTPIGKLIIPFGTYDRIETLSEGLAVVQKGKKYGYLDTAGKLVIPIKYDSADDFSEGLAAVSMKGKYGYIDKTGKLVIPFEYDSVRSFVDGIAMVFKNELWGYIDKTGKVIVPCEYEYIDHNNQFVGNRYIRFYKDGKLGFIQNKKELIVIFPGEYEYDYIDFFSEGLATVRKDGKSGCINTDGQLVIPCVYDGVGDFSDGVARAIKDGKWGVIDKSGNAVLPFEYDNISIIHIAGNPYIFIEDDSRLGYLAVSNLLKYTTNPEVIDPKPVVPAPTAFTDVPADQYFAQPVAWAVERGITTGTSATEFSPNNTCTTAQILTFLWHSQGDPAVSIANPFSDVAEDEYFYNAALWAYEKGLVEGTTFGGSTPCTRMSTVTYLWKLSSQPAPTTENKFTDVDSPAVTWAVEAGITAGTGDATFTPEQTCTRGQIVTFLYRYAN